MIGRPLTSGARQAHDITDGIMTSGRLRRLRRTLENLRRQGGIRAAALKRLATSLGRVERKKPGADHVWRSHFPGVRDVMISTHPSEAMNRFTARDVLDGLEEDLDRWEEMLESRREDTSEPN
jgi:hypothetical protein